MRFGRFLVESGAISEAQLLHALEIQHQRRKFIPQMAIELGYLSPTDVLRIMDSADDMQEDFVAMSVSEGLLKSRHVNELMSEWRRSALPLGMLLVELGFLTERQRCDLLAAYPGHAVDVK